MPRIIQENESDVTKRRLYFHIVNSDGISPSISESGGQPQISISGNIWTDSGIDTLTDIGNGRYYSTLDQNVLIVGNHIESRYKSVNTAEVPGDSIDVVDYDPTSLPSQEITVGVGNSAGVEIDHAESPENNPIVIRTGVR